MKITNRFLVSFLAVAVVSCSNGSKKKNSDDKIVDSFTASLKENKVVGDLFISLPGTYSIRHKGGPDFMVYYFGPADSTVVGDFSGGIYLGNFPQEFSPANDSCKTSSIKGKLLGNDPDWKVFTCDSTFFLQTIIDNKGDKSADKLHAFGKGFAGNEEKLMKVFTTVRRK